MTCYELSNENEIINLTHNYESVIVSRPGLETAIEKKFESEEYAQKKVDLYIKNKKNRGYAVKEIEHVVKDTPAIAIKRGRGRPRKNEKVIKAALPEGTVKRGRGRPKKIVR
jgi:hypothetical protein